jgi:hypothetical protein
VDLRTAGIGFDEATATWTLHTVGTTYAFRLRQGRLAHVYWGRGADRRGGWGPSGP